MKIGYARVSTVDQDAGLEAQIRDLKDAGCEKIFAEKISGTDSKRPELLEALGYGRPGDVLVVTKPDRLARSTADLLSYVKTLREKDCGLIVLSMNGTTLDTTSPTSKLMLTMLAAVAEFERDLMLERQREGIAKAKAEGRPMGRPRTVLSKTETIRQLRQKGLSAADIARKLGIARSGVYRALETEKV
ncbi:DNA resolvase [Acetobacter malorum DSM 14337]|uniref:DNA resolvase n=1 Tax=Acetobacter malorum DSM 14337 TaxID=1307910 RepID=A0ABQ0PM85_9PROT|nr:recombinase family protein [Acetobacter malorum]KXV07019.1 integrase [Acetobacter malorum]GBQ75762.1 DNA resolvase [Acetobacter malorum DSM 14337]